MAIHPTAIVDPKAEIDSTADVGAYAIIEGPVKIGPETRVYPHAYITGRTEIGAKCEIHPHAVIGHHPQHVSEPRVPSECFVGDGTIIREGASIHRSMYPDGKTVVGKGCYLMVNSHVAHDCRLADEVQLINGALLGGHVEVGRRALISGNAVVHQFVRVGEFVMTQGLSKLTMDVPPYFMVHGLNQCSGLNVVGLRRGGFSQETRAELKDAFRTLYRSGMTFRAAVAALDAKLKTDAGRTLVTFLQAESKRGFCSGRPRPHERAAQTGPSEAGKADAD